jgi:hypothetical protein
VSRPGQPRFNKDNPGDENANGGDYDLILAIRNPDKDFGRLRCGEAIPKNKEIPAILADGGISSR